MTVQEIQDYMNRVIEKIFHPNLIMRIVVEEETENYLRVICFVNGKRINSCDMSSTDSKLYIQQILEIFLVEDIIPYILF